jgi:aconitate hydratase/homoaconitate hydratase
MTLTQKILAHHARGLTRPFVKAGDVLEVSVDWTLASELAWNGMERTYQALGRPPLRDPGRFYLAVDHTVDPITLAGDPRARALTEKSRAFAREHGLRHFYDANQTILHTKFYRDLVLPGQVVLGADSHTSSHGGMGAFAVGLGGADVTAAMVLGHTWIEVPDAIRIDYEGELPFGLTGKDVILRTLGQLGRNTVALERTVEYGGSAARTFSTDLRFTLANMTAELGGFNGIFEPDAQVAAWLAGRSEERTGALYFCADERAPYVARFTLRLEKLAPQVARPFSPDNVAAVESCAGLPLEGCFIGACTTTEEELVLGALVLEQAQRGKPAQPPSPKKLVVPGDLTILGRLRETGLLALYERAGFRVGPPGCSMCLGVASEKAGRGEVWLSSQNRNYENRMGPGSVAYLASAPTVAASAIDLTITDPRRALATVDQDRLARLLVRPHIAPLPEVTLSEPILRASQGASAPLTPASWKPGPTPTVRGRVQRFGDDVDTDAIIPGEFCHLTEPQALGAKAFFHVRPDFVTRVADGQTVIVAGRGWGSGSSREQAVWALQGAGIQAVIARSFAFIHKRNLVNEALPFLVIRDDDFYALAQEGECLELDLHAARVRHPASGREFSAELPGPVLQSLQAMGSLLARTSRLIS